MKIWANTIVNNEENFLYFSVMSIAEHVDKILLWDTGSDDNTGLVISELKKKFGDKIETKEVGKVDAKQFTKMRQKMLDGSNCDWIIILDGDEIWWEDSIKKLVSEIKENGEKIDGIVVPMIVPVGDIYHIQEEKAGRYNILGKTGHISLKAINNNIPGLHVDWPYGREGYFDGDNHLVQDREKVEFINAPFLHATHLRRSNSKRVFNKMKSELGEKVDDKFRFPEVLYKNYPAFISSPWIKITGIKKLKASILTPFRKLKRRII